MGLVIPYVFAPGTVADATQVNADFNAVTAWASSNVRTTLQAGTFFYVSPSGADAQGNGLTPTTPCATIGYVLNTILRGEYDLNLQQVTIQLANGTYNETVVNAGVIPGLALAGSLIIQGNMAQPNLVTWTGDPCIDFRNGALGIVQGMTMTSTTGNCIICQLHSRAAFNNIIFGAAGASHIVASRGGIITALGNYTISGNPAEHHVRALQNADAILSPDPGDYSSETPPIGSPTITIGSGIHWGISFIQASTGSFVGVGAVFSGSATGVRGEAYFNGVIRTYGQGPTYLPGDTAPVMSNGGIVET